MPHNLWPINKKCHTLKYSRTFTVNFAAQFAFFLTILLYALLGLNYDVKDLDFIMLASWIYYFLLSFRNEFKPELIMQHLYFSCLTDSLKGVLLCGPIQVITVKMIVDSSKSVNSGSWATYFEKICVQWSSRLCAHLNRRICKRL